MIAIRSHLRRFFVLLCAAALLLSTVTFAAAEEKSNSMFTVKVVPGRAAASFDEIADSRDYYLHCDVSALNERVHTVVCEALHADVITPDRLIMPEKTTPPDESASELVYNISLSELHTYDVIMFTALDVNGAYLDSIQLLCIRQDNGDTLLTWLES